MTAATGKTRDDVIELLMAKAVTAATTAVERHSILRGTAAKKAATVALHAGKESLRIANTIKLAGATRGEGLAALGAGVAILALDVWAHITYARRGTRRQRTAAAVAVAAHLGFFTYGRIRNVQVRNAAYRALEEQTRG